MVVTRKIRDEGDLEIQNVGREAGRFDTVDKLQAEQRPMSDVGERES